MENKEIHAHKAVLKIRCEHFRSMFQVGIISLKRKVFSTPLKKRFEDFIRKGGRGSFHKTKAWPERNVYFFYSGSYNKSIHFFLAML